MIEDNKGFDCMAFYKALDVTRDARKLNWKQVAEATGVNASTLTRMSQDKRPDADSLATLSAWSGLNPANFVNMKGKATQAEALAIISASLRSDPKLSLEGVEFMETMIQAAYKNYAK